jgi:hypothetical protein
MSLFHSPEYIDHLKHVAPNMLNIGAEAGTSSAQVNVFEQV